MNRQSKRIASIDLIRGIAIVDKMIANEKVDDAADISNDCDVM